MKYLAVMFVIAISGLVDIDAEALFSETWGFRLDLPEAYQYTDGDGRNRFSFRNDGLGAACDVIVYEGGRYTSAELLGTDVINRLSATGDMALFEYEQRQAVLLQLDFTGPLGPSSAWGLGIELDGTDAYAPYLLVLAYGPEKSDYLDFFHLSILDSIAPSPAERMRPGPVTHFSYPPGEKREYYLAGVNRSAFFDPNDYDASQAVVDREFNVLRAYLDSPLWQEAWKRFYRTIYRDSFDRLSDAAFVLERYFSTVLGTEKAANSRNLAQAFLDWVQNFAYERDFLGSDFVNPVSAAIEGRGDCDSRALLWAIMLRHANIESAIMVSREYSHAMGLALLDGEGARFMLGNKNMLMAETTDRVSLGLINAATADPAKWLGIILE